MAQPGLKCGSPAIYAPSVHGSDSEDREQAGLKGGRHGPGLVSSGGGDSTTRAEQTADICFSQPWRLQVQDQAAGRFGS